jgi:hypothetical protein
VLNIACCFWDANELTNPLCGSYDESWVEKYYNGFKRNLTIPFRFVCFTEKRRDFGGLQIHQEIFTSGDRG